MPAPRKFVPKNCAVCNRRFIPKGGRQLVCDEVACQEEQAKRRESSRIRGSKRKKCVVCKAPFQARSGSQLTCGPACAKNRLEAKKLAWRETHRNEQNAKARAWNEANRRRCAENRKKWLTKNR